MSVSHVRKPGAHQHVSLGGQKRRTPGWIVIRRPTRDAAGRTFDEAEARATFADRPWADEVRYLGVERREHVFERPPAEPTP